MSLWILWPLQFNQLLFQFSNHFSEQPGDQLRNSMEEIETKLCSSDKEEAFKRELPYCIGEIDFTASGKKRGKVQYGRLLTLLHCCCCSAVTCLALKVEIVTVRINIPQG